MIIDKPEQIELYQMLVLRSALKLEMLEGSSTVES